MIIGQKDPETGIDEHWFNEWVEYGMTELKIYLRKVDAFEEYYRSRRPRKPVPNRSAKSV